MLDVAGEQHGFNDLVVTRGNDVYATHMFKDAAVYRITQKDQKLEVFAAPEDLRAFVFLKNAFPVNVLNAVKGVPEVCRPWSEGSAGGIPR